MRKDAWPRTKPSVKVKLGENGSYMAGRAGKVGDRGIGVNVRICVLALMCRLPRHVSRD